MKTVLCAIDFSPCSHDAMMAAVDVASRAGGTLALIHVIELPGYLVGGYLAEAAYAEQARGKADQTIHRWAAEAEEAMRAPVTAKALVGVPWKTIADAARDGKCDLLVVGTHGRTGLSRAFIGSVAERLVRHAPCSVLVVRGSV